MHQGTVYFYLSTAVIPSHRSNLKALEEQQLALKTERDELKKKEELDKSKHEKALEDLKKCQYVLSLITQV